MEGQRAVWDREYGKRGTRWSKNTLTLPQALGGKVVLEAGVGDGKTLRAILDQKPKEVVAVDYSRQALRKCAGYDGRVTFGRADALNLPFAGGVFDAVVLYYVLDNMLEGDRVKAVGEAHRVLKSGGIVLFEDFAAGDFRERTGKAVKELEPHTHLKGKGLICHYFTVFEVSGLFGDYAKGEIDAREYPPFKNSKNLTRRIISGIFVK